MTVLIILSVKLIQKSIQIVSSFRIGEAFHKEPQDLAVYYQQYYSWLLVATANNRRRQLAATLVFIKPTPLSDNIKKPTQIQFPTKICISVTMGLIHTAATMAPSQFLLCFLMLASEQGFKPHNKCLLGGIGIAFFLFRKPYLGSCLFTLPPC